MRPPEDTSELQLKVKEFATLESINPAHLKEIQAPSRVHVSENYKKRPRDGDYEKKAKYIPLNAELPEILPHYKWMPKYMILRPIEFQIAPNESTYL